MSEEKRLFDPAPGETSQERFVTVDRAAAGLPPKGYRSHDEIADAARREYLAGVREAKVHLEDALARCDRISAQWDKDSQKDTMREVAKLRRRLRDNQNG